MMVFNNSLALSRILAASKDAFPIDACTIPVLSTLKSILPPLTSLTAFLMSIVTVPVFGLGIKPRGPNTRPKGPNLPITLGMVTITSTSVQPSLIFCKYSSNPTKSAPPSSASASLSGVTNARTRTFLPVP